MPIHDNIYQSIQKSLIKFAVDFGNKRGLQFINFDAHAHINDIPSGDFVGIDGYSLLLDDQFVEVDIGFGITIENDAALMRHGEIMGELLNVLKPTMQIPIVNPELGDETGWMVIQNGVRVFGITRAKTRAVQFVAITLSSSQTLSLTA